MSAEKNQLELSLRTANGRAQGFRTAKPKVRDRLLPERISGIDQVLTTDDVVRITGRHRCTIYRWVLAGTFPPKRAGGGRGWLRSEIERWLKGASSDLVRYAVAKMD